MSAGVGGLHHVTAIAGEARANRAFYAGTLGLRLVKRTVNFDAPEAWHLYYGDGVGAPGTAMTFFVWAGGGRGRVGAGQATRTLFAVPPGALGFWRARLAAAWATGLAETRRFGEARLLFADPDGLPLALVEAEDPRPGWGGAGIGPEHAIRGFHGVALTLRDARPTADILTGLFGYAEVGGRLRREAAAGWIEIEAAPDAPRGRDGAGAVHHIAFSVADEAAQDRARAAMEAAGLRVTDRYDRTYFRSIYCRTPGGVLVELATDGPGFAVDEPEARLGETLRLPPRHEPRRAEIERALPPLD